MDDDASGLAARALLLGIFSLFALGLFAPWALHVARQARVAAAADPDPSSASLARAGEILATIGCVWLGFWLLVLAALVISALV
jgi:hypothetical protein